MLPDWIVTEPWLIVYCPLPPVQPVVSRDSGSVQNSTGIPPAVTPWSVIVVPAGGGSGPVRARSWASIDPVPTTSGPDEAGSAVEPDGGMAVSTHVPGVTPMIV